MFHGYRVCDDKASEMDPGDDCTTMKLDVMPLNCTLKIVKMVYFVLYTLYFTTIKHNDMQSRALPGCHTEAGLLRGRWLRWPLHPVGSLEPGSEVPGYRSQQVYVRRDHVCPNSMLQHGNMNRWQVTAPGHPQ